MDKKNYSVSNRTKQALSDALKALMSEKPMEKITIRELTDRCGMRRQNFYYHFDDIYGLLYWTLQQEAETLIRIQEESLFMQDGLLALFRYVQENSAFCRCALHSMGHELTEKFLDSQIRTVIQERLDAVGMALNKGHSESPKLDTELLAKFYAIALSGLLESWVLGEIDRTPEALAEQSELLLRDIVSGVALRLSGGAAPLQDDFPII